MKEQVAEIRSLIEELSSERQLPEYKPLMQRSIDERISVTIRYKWKDGIKSVVLAENDSHLHLDESADVYPHSLVKLLKLNYRLGAAVRKDAG